MFINNNKTGKVFFITLNFIMKSSPTIFSSSSTFFAVAGDRPHFLKFLESTLQTNIVIFFCHFAFTSWFGHLSVVLFNTKLKVNNFIIIMSLSYINVNNNINVYYQEFIFKLHSPF